MSRLESALSELTDAILEEVEIVLLRDIGNLSRDQIYFIAVMMDLAVDASLKLAIKAVGSDEAGAVDRYDELVSLKCRLAEVIVYAAG